MIFFSLSCSVFLFLHKKYLPSPDIFLFSSSVLLLLRKKIFLSTLLYFYTCEIKDQGGRSCAKAKRSFAEMFGLGQNFQALTYAMLSSYYDLSRFTHFLEDFGQKMSPFGSKTYCILYWIAIANLRLHAKTTAFVAKIANTRPTKTFVAFFALAERQLLQPQIYRVIFQLPPF